MLISETLCAYNVFKMYLYKYILKRYAVSTYGWRSQNFSYNFC